MYKARNTSIAFKESNSQSNILQKHRAHIQNLNSYGAVSNRSFLGCFFCTVQWAIALAWFTCAEFVRKLGSALRRAWVFVLCRCHVGEGAAQWSWAIVRGWQWTRAVLRVLSGGLRGAATSEIKCRCAECGDGSRWFSGGVISGSGEGSKRRPWEADLRVEAAIVVAWAVRLCLFVEEGCCLVATLGGNFYSSTWIE